MTKQPRPDAAQGITQVPFDHPDVAGLVDEVQSEYTHLYGTPDDSPIDSTMFDPPQGAFFLCYAEGVAVAMGGWGFRREVSAFSGRRTAEIRRMYVAATARRRGFARALLTHLERTAHAAGADVMVLETGIVQPQAIALYEAAGYVPIEKFGHYSWSPKSRCFGKRLPG